MYAFVSVDNYNKFTKTILETNDETYYMFKIYVKLVPKKLKCELTGIH